MSPYASPRPIKSVARTPSPVNIKHLKTPSPAFKSEESKKLKKKYQRDQNLPKIVYNKSSNRKIIKSAISGVCLAGDVNRHQRDSLLSIIDKAKDIDFFIILFNSFLKRDIRALYTHDPDTKSVLKVYGSTSYPLLLSKDMVKVYYRYNTWTRDFEELICNDFILPTDAVVLKSRLRLVN